jgi:hypothetical protein
LTAGALLVVPDAVVFAFAGDVAFDDPCGIVVAGKNSRAVAMTMMTVRA